jgi:hypothetical protein
MVELGFSYITLSRLPPEVSQKVQQELALSPREFQKSAAKLKKACTFPRVSGTILNAYDSTYDPYGSFCGLYLCDFSSWLFNFSLENGQLFSDEYHGRKGKHVGYEKLVKHHKRGKCAKHSGVEWGLPFYGQNLTVTSYRNTPQIYFKKLCVRDEKGKQLGVYADEYLYRVQCARPCSEHSYFWLLSYADTQVPDNYMPKRRLVVLDVDSNLDEVCANWCYSETMGDVNHYSSHPDLYWGLNLHLEYFAPILLGYMLNLASIFYGHYLACLSVFDCLPTDIWNIVRSLMWAREITDLHKLVYSGYCQHGSKQDAHNLLRFPNLSRALHGSSPHKETSAISLDFMLKTHRAKKHALWGCGNDLVVSPGFQKPELHVGVQHLSPTSLLCDEEDI